MAAPKQPLNFFNLRQLQKVGEKFVKKYKYNLLKKMTDLEDVAAWLVVWAVPLGTLVTLLRGNPELDLHHEAFAPVFETGMPIESYRTCPCPCSSRFPCPNTPAKIDL